MLRRQLLHHTDLCFSYLNDVPTDIILPSSVSLPANRGRTINILCQVFPDNDIYNMYQLTWDGLGMDDMMPLGDMNSYIYYQRSACMSLNITCIGESFSEFSNESRTTDATIIISVVGTLFVISL